MDLSSLSKLIKKNLVGVIIFALLLIGVAAAVYLSQQRATVNTQAATKGLNCMNLAGPDTGTVGQELTYTSFHKIDSGILDADIVVAPANQPENIVDCNSHSGDGGCYGNSIGSTSGNQSFTWKPSQAGTYVVYCRSFEQNIQECRGNQEGADKSGSSLVSTCTGPAATKTVVISNADGTTPTPTPTPSGNSDGVAPVTTATFSDLSGNTITSFTTGQQVKIKLRSTDNSGSVKVIHTAVRSNVNSAAEAKNPLSTWEAGYRGLPGDYGELDATAPFYLEYLAVDAAGNQEQTKSYQATASGGGGGTNPTPTPTPTADPGSGKITLSGKVTDMSGNPLAGKVVNSPDLPSISGCNVGPATSGADGRFSIPNVEVGKYTCLRVLNATQSYECQTIGQSKGTISCGGGTTVDQPTDDAYNFTVDTTPPTTTVVIKEATGKILQPGQVTHGQKVTVNFTSVDNQGGTGAKVIHTAVRENVTTEQAAKTPLSEWENSYKGIAPTNTSREVTAPFYLEYLGEDFAKNLETTNKLLVAPGVETTTKFRIAESAAALDSAPDQPWTGGSKMTVPFTFSSTAVGTKVIYVRFYSSNGNTSQTTASIRLTEAAPAVSFFLEPATAEAAFDETFTLNMKMNAQSYNISAMELFLKFDKDKIQVDTTSSVITLPQSSKLQVLGFNEANNLNGTIHIALGRKAEQGLRVTGEVDLGTLKFKAKKIAGDTRIDFDKVIVSSSDQSGALPLGTNQGSVVTVGPKGYTTHYKISEDKAALEDDSLTPWQDYSDRDGQEPITTSYTFKNVQSNPLFLFVKFKNSNGKVSQVYQKQIRYIGGNPTISNVVCRYSVTGSGTQLTINGQNFGATRGNGKVKITGGGVNKDATIVSWSDTVSHPSVSPVATQSAALQNASGSATASPSATPAVNQSVAESRGSVVASIPDRPTGTITVQLTTNDNRSVSSDCVINTTTVTFTARNTCLSTDNFAEDDVEVSLAENAAGAKPVTQRIKLDKEGKPQGFTPIVQSGLRYILLVKAKNTLAKSTYFTAGEGTTNANGGRVIDLMVGDVAPANAPDGKINSLDKSEIARQWILTGDASRSADLNKDRRVNSIDYSCMRKNFNHTDDNLDPTP